MLRDPESDLFKGADEFLKQFLVKSKARAAALGDKEKVPYKLSGSELRSLEKVFDVKVQTVPREASVMPLASAAVWMAAKRNERIKAWDGESIVYIDASISDAVARVKTYWHVCRTHASSRLSVKYLEENETLRRMATGKNGDLRVRAASVMQDCFSGHRTAQMCSDAAVCDWRADTILLDLCYVSPAPVQVAATIRMHGAVRAKLWFFFETAMLEHEYGELSAFPGKFWRDDERDLLHIIPYGAPKACCSYTWSVVKAYATCQTVEHQGVRYFCEIVDRVPGILFVVMADAAGECETGTLMERRLDTGVRGKVDVELRMFVARAVAKSAKSEVVKIRLDESVWERVCTRLLAMPADKMTVQAARVAVADFSQQRVDVGAFLKLPVAVLFDVPEVFAQAAFRYVCIQKVALAVESQRAIGVVARDWDATVGHLAAVLLRAMWDNGSSFAAEMLSLDGLVKKYAVRACTVRYDDYVVKVVPAPEEVVVTEAVGRTDGECGARAHAATCPGFPAVGREAVVEHSVCSSEADLVRARALAVVNDVDEAERTMRMWEESGVYSSSEYESDDVSDSVERIDVEHVREQEQHRASSRDLGSLREDAVQKLQEVTADNLVRPVVRMKEVLPAAAVEEEYDDEVSVGDVVGTLQETFSRLFPLCTSIDFEARPYVLADSDRVHVYEAPLVVTNASKDVGPECRRIVRSKLHTDVGGKRPVTQAAALTAISKRIANAPDYSSPANYEQRLEQDFQLFASVALRPGWEARMKEAVKAGLWALDEDVVRAHVAKLTSGNVGRVIAEDFRLSKINLTNWLTMVKSTAKSRMEESAYFSEAAPQTIVYQESKVTNSWFSTKLSKFHDFLDQELVPHVRINARKDEDDDEQWQSSMLSRYQGCRSVVLETDISQCDKSQRLYNMCLYFYIFEKFGAPEWLIDLWKVIVGKKKATAMNVGVVVEYLYQVVSGFWGTISANSLIVSIANMRCCGVTPGNLLSFENKGDDVVLFMRELKLSHSEISDRFKEMYNFEAKVYEVVVPYQCSKYKIFLGERAYNVRDPVKAIASLGRSLASSADKFELWQSLRDSLRHYGDKNVMAALDVAVQERLKCDSIRSSLRALSQIKRSYESFCECFDDGVIELS